MLLFKWGVEPKFNVLKYYITKQFSNFNFKLYLLNSINVIEFFVLLF